MHTRTCVYRCGSVVECFFFVEVLLRFWASAVVVNCIGTFLDHGDQGSCSDLWLPLNSDTMSTSGNKQHGGLPWLSHLQLSWWDFPFGSNLRNLWYFSLSLWLLMLSVVQLQCAHLHFVSRSLFGHSCIKKCRGLWAVHYCLNLKKGGSAVSDCL